MLKQGCVQECVLVCMHVLAQRLSQNLGWMELSNYPKSFFIPSILYLWLPTHDIIKFQPY